MRPVNWIVFFSCIICLLACDAPRREGANPLYVDPATRDFRENPDLLERIKSGAHGYFRFINIPFSQHVCEIFAGMLTGAPNLNLHGDAHIEQYAVTDLGRGLTDFDDSCNGPGIIDIMRFGVSVRLACREHGWQDSSAVVFGHFLRGYEDALDDPETVASEPAVVTRIRSTFEYDRQSYLEWVESVMQPMPAAERDALSAAFQEYVRNMVAENPEWDAEYFEIVKLGYLRMGIGSALDMKYLVQVRGPSEAPEDDVVLECKEVRDLSGIDCINSGQKINPFRILLGQARIAYRPFHHLGYFTFRAHNFWVHSWVDNYQEVEIGKTFQSLQELQEVAYDVGVQLGRGHVKHIGAPFGLQIRREQRALLESKREAIISACDRLSELVVTAWQRFLREVGA